MKIEVNMHTVLQMYLSTHQQLAMVTTNIMQPLGWEVNMHTVCYKCTYLPTNNLPW